MLAASLICLSLAVAETPPPGAGVPSLEALLEASLAALSARDTTALAGLSAGREDFLAAYPAFAVDTSAARRDFACGYFLSDNRKLLLRGLDREGGRGLALSRFEVEGPVERYGRMTLFRGLRIWVRDGEGERELGLLGSAAKTPDKWRIWSYSDE